MSGSLFIVSRLIDFLLIVSFVIASIPSTDYLPPPPDLVPRDRVSLCLPDEEIQSHCVATEAVAQSKQLKLIHQKLWIIINPFYDGICLAVFAILLMSIPRHSKTFSDTHIFSTLGDDGSPVLKSGDIGA